MRQLSLPQALRKMRDPKTPQDAARMLTAMAERTKRNAVQMKFIAGRFWPASSHIAHCMTQIYDYAKELQGYMEHHK